MSGPKSSTFDIAMVTASRPKRKLSPRRANEFRERWLKNNYGNRRERAGRKEYLRILCKHVPLDMQPPWLVRMFRKGKGRP